MSKKPSSIIKGWYNIKSIICIVKWLSSSIVLCWYQKTVSVMSTYEPKISDRVVCRFLLIAASFVLISEFSNWDLPALGRPTITISSLIRSMEKNKYMTLFLMGTKYLYMHSYCCSLISFIITYVLMHITLICIYITSFQKKERYQ